MSANPLSRSYGPISDHELPQIISAAQAEFDQDSPEFLTPLFKSLPPTHLWVVANRMLALWHLHRCPLKIGESLIEMPLFRRNRSIQPILLNIQGIPSLGQAFLAGNFKMLTVLQNHPESALIDADYIVKAINHATTGRNDTPFHQNLANALIALLPKDMLKKVQKHKRLRPLVEAAIQQQQQQQQAGWNLLLTALSVADASRQQNTLSNSLDKLVRNSLFEPRLLSIVKQFLL